MIQEPTTKRLITIAEVCRYIGFSRATVYRWLDDPANTFPRPLKFERGIRWRLADLEAWEDALAAKARK